MWRTILLSAHFSTKISVASSLPNLYKYGSLRLDLNNLLSEFPAIKQNVENRKVKVDLNKLLSLFHRYSNLRKEIGTLGKRCRDHEDFKADVDGIEKDRRRKKMSKRYRDVERGYEDELEENEKLLVKVEKELIEETRLLPNWTHPGTPVGEESKAKVVEVFGAKPKFGFRNRDAFDIGKLHNMFDFENAARLTGSKFAYFKNDAVKVEHALIQWAMQNIREKGFTPVMAPEICQQRILDCCGFHPRDNSSQIYNLSSPCGHSMIATSEIPLAGLLCDSVVKHSELPLRYCGFSHCYRKEAGQGKDARGIYRLHQFSKVEMFAFTEDSTSGQMLEEFLQIEIALYKQLGFCFRLLEMPTEELGASAYRKFDIEVWLPSKKAFCEITSASNCTDYQSVRLNAMYLDKEGVKRPLHTVNGTGCAIPRVMMALMEYYQRPDGTFSLPEVLKKFLPDGPPSMLNKQLISLNVHI